MFVRKIFTVGLYLMLSSTLKAYPFWSPEVAVEMPAPDLKNKKITDYLKARDTLACTNSNQTCLAFYANNLENKNQWIADEAFNYVSVQPLNLIRENVDSFPLANLRRSILNQSVAPSRRDFYAFIVGIKKHPADRAVLQEVLDDFLAKESLRQVSMVGVLAGFALSGSHYATNMFIKTLRFNYAISKNQSEPHADNVLTALELLKEEFPGVADAYVGTILKAAMQRNSEMRERALVLAERWLEPALATMVWEQLKKGEGDDSFKGSAKSYCSVIQEEACHLVLVWFQDQETLQAIPRLAQPTSTPIPSPTAEAP